MVESNIKMSIEENDVKILIERVDSICKFVNKMKVDIKTIKGRVDVLESDFKTNEENDKKNTCKLCVELKSEMKTRFEEVNNKTFSLEYCMKVQKEKASDVGKEVSQ